MWAGRAAAARRGLLVGVAALCGACAGPPAARPGAAPPLAGRLALQVEAHREREARAVSASFELSGDAERGELRLSTPLGTTLVEARWTPGQAVLITPSGQTTYADLDALSRDAFGEVLPLRALPDWLLGRPWPAAASQPLAAPAGPGFEQFGWTVDSTRAAEGQIRAWRPGPPAVRLRTQLERPS